jgi:CBS domain-containing protein
MNEQRTEMTSSASDVRGAMTSSPRSIDGAASVVEAAKLMVAENVGSLPVVDGSRLVGIVTDRDVVIQVVAGERDPATTTVSEICSTEPAVAHGDESLVDALTRMAAKQVRRLPVVEGDELIGMLSQADVARAAEFEATGKMVDRISQD